MSIIVKDGETIRRSESLADLTGYAAKSQPVAVGLKETDRDPTGGIQPYGMVVHYADGSRGYARWTDPFLAAERIAARRTWDLALADVFPDSDTTFLNELARRLNQKKRRRLNRRMARWSM